MLLTIGEVAERQHVPVHRVEYVVATRKIMPASRAGKYRLFGEAEVEAIAAALRECETRLTIRASASGGRPAG